MLKFDDFKLDKCADGLLPVIVQDAVTLKVLMLGYMNREAFDKSMAEGRVSDQPQEENLRPYRV